MLGYLFPVFALIVLGRAAVALKLIEPSGVKAINSFTVNFAFPALLFGAIANGASLQVFGVAGVYLAGCLVIYGTALVIARFVLGWGLSDSAAFALNATYGSAAYMAMPTVATMFGTPGVAVIVPIIALHSAILLPLAAFLIEIGGCGGQKGAIGKTLRGLARNPILLSIAAGAAWQALGVPLPRPVFSAFHLLGDAAPSLALFCVGASLPASQRGHITETVAATALKLGALPIVIGTIAFGAGITGVPLKVALLTAAMPTGANAFVVASRAAAFAETSARIVVTTLGASALVLSGLLIGLG